MRDLNDSVGRLDQRLVQRRQRDSVPHGEFQIGGVSRWSGIDSARARLNTSFRARLWSVSAVMDSRLTSSTMAAIWAVVMRSCFLARASTLPSSRCHRAGTSAPSSRSRSSSRSVFALVSSATSQDTAMEQSRTNAFTGALTGGLRRAGFSSRACRISLFCAAPAVV